METGGGSGFYGGMIMLTIAVKPGEYFVVGDDIVVQVVECGSVFRLAVQAPRELPILRGELYEEDHPTPPCVVHQRKKIAQRQKKDPLWYTAP